MGNKCCKCGKAIEDDSDGLIVNYDDEPSKWVCNYINEPSGKWEWICNSCYKINKQEQRLKMCIEEIYTKEH